MSVFSAAELIEDLQEKYLWFWARLADTLSPCTTDVGNNRSWGWRHCFSQLRILDIINIHVSAQENKWCELECLYSIKSLKTLGFWPASLQLHCSVWICYWYSVWALQSPSLASLTAWARAGFSFRMCLVSNITDRAFENGNEIQLFLSYSIWEMRVSFACTKCWKLTLLWPDWNSLCAQMCNILLLDR